MVLGKLPVPGRPTYLDNSGARAYCACSRCGRGCLDIFSLICHFSFLSPSLWEAARYRLKYCLKGPLSQKQPTNQPTDVSKYLLYQRIKFGHNPYFYLHFKCCYLKLLISQSKFSETRKFTLIYQ